MRPGGLAAILAIVAVFSNLLTGAHRPSTLDFSQPLANVAERRTSIAVSSRSQFKTIHLNGKNQSARREDSLVAMGIEKEVVRASQDGHHCFDHSTAHFLSFWPYTACAGLLLYFFSRVLFAPESLPQEDVPRPTPAEASQHLSNGSDSENMEKQSHTPCATIELLCFASFLSALYHTLIIPDSLQVARKLHQSAAFSGVLISSHKTSSFFGQCVAWWYFRRNPDAWRYAGRWAAFAEGFLLIVGSLMYGYVAGLNSDQSWQPLVLMLSRFISGFSAGLRDSTVKIIVRESIPFRYQAEQYVWLSCLTMLGLGCGPLFDSGAKMVLIGRCASMQAGCFAFAAVCALFVLAVMLKPSSEVHPLGAGSRSATASEGDGPAQYGDNWPYIVAACLVMSTCRAFVVSGVEAATAMILEVDFFMQPGSIGVFIGCCFLVALPWKLIVDALKAKASLATIVRPLILAALGGSCLLFQLPCRTMMQGNACKCESLIFTGDAIIFPAFFLAGSMSQAASMSLSPVTGPLSINNVILAENCAIDLIGRGLSPPLARGLLEYGGRSAYVLSQQVAMCVGWAALEIGVLKYVGAPKQSLDKQNKGVES